MGTASRRRVRFVEPGEADVVRETLSGPAAGEVMIDTVMSAISPGTERLVFEGRAPTGMKADASIEGLRGQDLSFPISYGYACVGQVQEVGTEVDEEWLGRRVFAFRPHVSRFCATPDELVPLPDGVDVQDAVLIPMMETAVNLAMDGRPMVGEMVLVLGQGVVGLLTTQLVARYPVAAVATVDPIAARRERSKHLGATEVAGSVSELNISDTDVRRTHDGRISHRESGVDLAYELTGQPDALNDALAATGFEGRIVLGSWYGDKQTAIDLGGDFHRSRISIVSSQVSTIASEYRGRWSKSRRMAVVLNLLDALHPGRLISDQFSVEEAPSVYPKLGTDASMLQPVFVYE